VRNAYSGSATRGMVAIPVTMTKEIAVQISAAVARETGAPFTIEQLELDDLGHNEVRVRMVATGICHTDTLVRDGVYPTPLPAVLGHEGAGIVEAVGLCHFCGAWRPCGVGGCGCGHRPQ
jgi:hypothetical protein